MMTGRTNGFFTAQSVTLEVGWKMGSSAFKACKKIAGGQLPFRRMGCTVEDDISLFPARVSHLKRAERFS
jgi:hypothetical protein